VPSSSKNTHWPILKNIISLVGGRVFISLSRLLISLIIVRLAGADLFGEYVVVMSIIFIGEWLVDFGFTDIAVRDISRTPTKKTLILHAFTAIKLIQVIICYGIIVFAIYLLGYKDFLEAIIIGGFAVIFYGTAQIYRVIFRLNMTMYKDMLSESCGVLVMIILAIVLSLKGASVTELVALHAISRLIYMFINIYFGASDYKIKLTFNDGQNISALIKQAAPLGIAGIMIAIYDSVFPLVISKLMDMEAVAQYTVAIRLVFPIIIVTQAIANVFYTPLSNYWNSSKKLFTSTQQNLVEITCFTAAAFFCLIYSGADTIVSIFGEEMSESASILQALSWAILARAVTTTMALPIIICGGQRKTMWLTLMVVTFSTAMVVYLVPIYGIFGAVATYLFVEIILNAIPIIFISQYMAKYKLNWLPISGIFFAAFLSILLISSLNIHGTAVASLFSVILFVTISYLLGIISNKKIHTIISIFKNRSIIINEDTRPLKVAMACPGVGLVQRGFERMFDDLFHLLKNDLDLTLYKGGGTVSAKEKNLIFISRNGWFLKYFPLHKLFRRTTQHVECLTFAISLLIATRGKGYEIIHCIDPPLARILYKLRKIFHLNFRLLYTEATAMPPGHYPPADHTQQISQITHQNAVENGIPENYMTVIPLGIYPENFTVTASKSELRKKYNIADDTFVVLCLAAINKYHKRIDYLIDEFKSINGDAILWIDGSLDQGDPELIQYAKNTLGKRCRITHLPSNQVGELFAVADLMIHTALFEAFGLALIEAASTGIPVITHNSAHFQWLLNNKPCTINMSIAGKLSEKINELMVNQEQLEALGDQEHTLKKYNWEVLKKDYLNMYVKTATLPANEIGTAHNFGLK